MPKLTDDEVSTFLAEPGHLLRVATVDADGMPRNVPIWYIVDDGRIVFTPRVHSVFLENLMRDPRVGLTIDEEALPYRKVTVQGRAELLYAPGADDGVRAVGVIADLSSAGGSQRLQQGVQMRSRYADNNLNT